LQNDPAFLIDNSKDMDNSSYNWKVDNKKSGRSSCS
jgi:hypothetical protein